MLTLPWLPKLLLAYGFAGRCYASQPELLHEQHPLLLNQNNIDHDPLLSLHRGLVEIESITGNEHDVGKYLHTYLSNHNFTVEEQEVIKPSTGKHNNKPRFNLLAYPGTQRATRILLSSHIDTVPPFWPYELHGDDEIWGRGTVDDKNCVAAQTIAVEQLLASHEIAPGDVGLLFVVGEETGGDGMQRANDLGLAWETVIFGEPTELKLAAGHKGTLGFHIKATGKAAHSGYPWLGESANSMLLPALLKLEKMELPWSEKYGNTTVNIGRMEGGVAMNVVAEKASAGILLRLANGTAAAAEKLVRDAVREVDERLEVTTTLEGYGPVDIDTDVEGFETITVNYGTDIPSLHGQHKRYLYGPGSILVAHSDHEHLKVQDLREAVDGYKRLIRHALKEK